MFMYRDILSNLWRRKLWFYYYYYYYYYYCYYKVKILYFFPGPFLSFLGNFFLLLGSRPSPSSSSWSSTSLSSSSASSSSQACGFSWTTSSPLSILFLPNLPELLLLLMQWAKLPPFLLLLLVVFSNRDDRGRKMPSSHRLLHLHCSCCCHACRWSSFNRSLLLPLLLSTPPQMTVEESRATDSSI